MNSETTAKAYNLDDVKFLLGLLSNAPPGELKKYIINKKNVIQEFEILILSQINPVLLDRLDDLFRIPIEDIYKQMDLITAKTDMIQLKLLNTQEGREFIKFNLDELKDLIEGI